MSANASGEIRAEPNLTPLLDVVFQLITFFMLVINFSNDTYDQRIRLPVAASASSPEAGKTDETRLVFNINSQGKLLFNGEELDTEAAIKEIKIQAELERKSAERAMKGKLDVAKDGLPTTIVIRCDRETQYDQLYRLITACQAQGFRKFSLKAMNAAS